MFRNTSSQSLAIDQLLRESYSNYYQGLAVQTAPVGTQSGQGGHLGFSSVFVAAASSPF